MPLPFMEIVDAAQLFECLPVALLAVAETTLCILKANAQAAANLGFTCQSLEGRILPELLADADAERLRTLLSTVGAQTSSPAELETCSVRNASGGINENDLSLSRLPGLGIVLVVIRDASGRGRLNEQLRQAQKMEALGMLAGGIAHDFNNLLTIISGYSQMLMASSKISAERDRTSIEQVLKASERAADLTSQLLAFSRRQTIQPKVQEINELIDQTAAMLGRVIGEDIDLRIEKAPDAGRVHADAGQIQQMIMNLVINARDAMPEGGSLRLTTGNAELGEDYVGQHLGVKAGSYVMLEVADTGTGMDEATRKRIFEPFFTTKAQGKGTGLGLSTVYGIVRQCGGSIDLFSEPGKGTTFRVYLPRVHEAVTAAPGTLGEARGGHETILLVEDEEGVRKMVTIALERCGYRVLVAGDGSEALTEARKYDGPIDLLVTDMIMPHMSGKELALKLLKSRPETGVLFISGYAGNTMKHAGDLESGADFLQKPFAPAILTARVREMLDARRKVNGSAVAGKRQG